MSNGKFTFMFEDPEGFGISMTCKEGKDIEGMLGAFEDFLFACGYRLHDGEVLGITGDGVPSDSGHGAKYKFDPGLSMVWDSGMASNFINCGVRGGISCDDIITFDNA